jgi:hypothetical protein
MTTRSYCGLIQVSLDSPKQTFVSTLKCFQSADKLLTSSKGVSKMNRDIMADIGMIVTIGAIGAIIAIFFY